MFNIPESEQSVTEWRSVSTILNDGVGRSTLPCAKLRAIVDAAREISHVYAHEHEKPGSAIENNEGETLQKAALGADDFLPIFIYSVVRAGMERPCALCKSWSRRFCELNGTFVPHNMLELIDRYSSSNTMRPIKSYRRNRILSSLL